MSLIFNADMRFLLVDVVAAVVVVVADSFSAISGGMT